MTKEQQPTKTRRVRPLAIALGIFFAIAAVVFAAYAIPLSMGDGTEKFEGAEKKAAQWALEKLDYDYRGFDKHMSFDVNFYVETVQPISPEDAAKVCGPYRKLDPDPSHHYAVKLGIRTLFGFKSDDVTYEGCIIPPSTWQESDIINPNPW